MNTQRNLFGAPNAYGAFEPPLARATDPASSHRAAAGQESTGKINSGSAIILTILGRVGKPSTYGEIWAAGTDAEREKLREASTVAKRLTVLERRGLVRAGPERVCTVGGAESREWGRIGHEGE